MATPMSASAFVSALKREGVKVSERYSGWRTHNRNHVGQWGGVNGVLIHHTAGRGSRALCYNGRSDLPGPLCHTHLAKDGTATMIGNGRANHAGKVARNAFNAVVNESSTHPRPSASSGTVDGNRHFYGIEIENLGTGHDPYPSVQYDAAVRWAAAICRHHGWTANSVVGHKETSIEGKPDPSFDMNRFRRDVAARLKGSASSGDSTNDSSEELNMNDKQVFEAVWGQDKLPAPSTSSTKATNKTWQPGNLLRELYDRVRELQDAVAELSKKVN
ncbi:N-acetylmuramoyl-L-alanine amidase [Streptomyces sp. NPDC007025]|uniref:N-acetylmuramoyl-L-alanine amidase n=1 Tax=Streptomyces sp. NPDC007025 TaxID=3364771 RepID=UPI003690BF93